VDSIPPALIPLSEFRDPTAMQQYGVHCDAEVLDMLDTAARQLEVRALSCSTSSVTVLGLDRRRK
jgi:hypothetical protein